MLEKIDAVHQDASKNLIRPLQEHPHNKQIPDRSVAHATHFRISSAANAGNLRHHMINLHNHLRNLSNHRRG